MSGLIQVTPAELHGMSQKYAEESQQVNDQIGRLNVMIQNLTEIWKGQSSEAFAEQYENLRPSFEAMERLLQDISTQLANTADALEDADKQIANQIRG